MREYPASRRPELGCPRRTEDATSATLRLDRTAVALNHLQQARRLRAHPIMTTITIAGNMVEPPTLRFTNSGRAVANLRVIENTQHRTNDGSYVDDDDRNTFHVVVWGKPAENVAESLDNGQEIFVVGSVRTESTPTRTEGRSATARSSPPTASEPASPTPPRSSLARTGPMARRAARPKPPSNTPSR